MVFNNGVRTASFLRIIKAFNFDLGDEELFYFYNVLHKCTAAINNQPILLVDTKCTHHAHKRNNRDSELGQAM